MGFFFFFLLLSFFFSKENPPPFAYVIFRGLVNKSTNCSAYLSQEKSPLYDSPVRPVHNLFLFSRFLAVMNNSHVFFRRIDIPRKEVEEGKEREREKERGGPLNEAKRVNLTVKQRLRSRKYRCFAAELQVGTIFLQFSRRFLCSLHFYLR